MCLIVFAWRPGHAQPLIVAANRDEFYARPSLPLAQWEDAPTVYAGRDQEAGGTWLGVNAEGRFAALTNIRDPHQPPARKSRGELVARFLNGSLPVEQYLADVNGRSIEYAGFTSRLNPAYSTLTAVRLNTPGSTCWWAHRVSCGITTLITPSPRS